MKALPVFCAGLASLGMALALIGSPARAGDDAAFPWQAVITSQIQAFRDHDAPAAFDHAGIAFQVAFPDAQAFFVAIVGSGYAPIMESSSHSFGAFSLLGEDGVMQQVRFVGSDHSLYDALYRLTEEAGRWRVQGVQLAARRGVAI